MRASSTTLLVLLSATVVFAVPTRALGAEGGRGADTEPAEERPLGEPCFPQWLPLAELGVGVLSASAGAMLFGHRVSGGNPTLPSLLVGLGAGGALSGLALLDANRRCALGQSTGPEFPRMQRTATFVTAGAAAMTFGIAGAFTLLHEPGRPAPAGVSAVGALMMGLSSALTVVGMNLLAAPEVPSRSPAAGARANLGFAPTTQGGMGTFQLTF